MYFRPPFYGYDFNYHLVYLSIPETHPLFMRRVNLFILFIYMYNRKKISLNMKLVLVDTGTSLQCQIVTLIIMSGSCTIALFQAEDQLRHCTQQRTLISHYYRELKLETIKAKSVSMCTLCAMKINMISERTAFKDWQNKFTGEIEFTVRMNYKYLRIYDIIKYAINKGADQPALPRSLVSAFVIHSLE